jgi:hypothetical protein
MSTVVWLLHVPRGEVEIKMPCEMSPGWGGSRGEK